MVYINLGYFNLIPQKAESQSICDYKLCISMFNTMNNNCNIINYLNSHFSRHYLKFNKISLRIMRKQYTLYVNNIQLSSKYNNYQLFFFNLIKLFVFSK